MVYNFKIYAECRDDNKAWTTNYFVKLDVSPMFVGEFRGVAYTVRLTDRTFSKNDSWWFVDTVDQSDKGDDYFYQWFKQSVLKGNAPYSLEPLVRGVLARLDFHSMSIYPIKFSPQEYKFRPTDFPFQAASQIVK